MKKHMNKIGIILLIVLVFSLSGCKKNPPEDVKGSIDDPKEPVEDVIETDENREKIMADFDGILDSKDIDKLVDFVDKNIGKLTTIEGDKMVLGLEALLEDSIEPWIETYLDLDEAEFNELIQLIENELFFPEGRVKDIEDKDLREKISRLFKNKFKLINLEGQFYPIIDYEAFKEYNKSVSDEVKDYIAIMAHISNEPMAADGALIISFDELANRVLEVEKYIQKYSQGQKYEDMLVMYETWLSLYLQGLPNTPIADYDTKKIYGHVLESYMATGKVEDSATAFVVSRYIGIIDENKGIINGDVIGKAVSLVNEALAALKTSK